MAIEVQELVDMLLRNDSNDSDHHTKTSDGPAPDQQGSSKSDIGEDDIAESGEDDIVESDKDDIVGSNKDDIVESDKDDIVESDNDDIMESDEDGRYRNAVGRNTVPNTSDSDVTIPDSVVDTRDDDSAAVDSDATDINRQCSDDIMSIASGDTDILDSDIFVERDNIGKCHKKTIKSVKFKNKSVRLKKYSYS